MAWTSCLASPATLWARAVRLGLVAGLCVAWAVLVAGLTATGPRFHELDEADRAAAARHGIEVVTPDGPVTVWVGGARVTGGPASSGDLHRAAPVLGQELDLYPPELVREARLWRVVLCGGLVLDGEPAAGLADVAQGVLYLDAAGMAEDPAYARLTIHHEFFHVVDYRDDGRLDADPAWEALNPAGFQYGPGGKAAVADPNLNTGPSDQVPGFLSGYARSAVEEDKAETFAYLVAEPDYVAARSERDPVLRAKTARIRALVAGFCPAAGDEFWERVHRARVDQRAAERADAGEPGGIPVRGGK